MNPELWKQAQQVFHDASMLEGDARSDYLERACAGDPGLRAIVDELLRADSAAPTWLDRGAHDVSAFLSTADEGSMPGRLGPYRVLDEIGQGGMGTVYLAEREDDFRMRVAIKSVRPGPASEELLERFGRERQILAGLQHPGIARLLDGGRGPDGRPWFAMEYVDGTPIDAYCDGRRLGIVERVWLVIEVCRIVQYAHRSLVLHRDLKPSNVLVTTDGRPKLLDFGIARILSAGTDAEPALTRLRQPLTPQYASPEQFRDDPLTTASDVYQLGLMLYQLLTGRSPHEGTTSERELARARTEEEPERPSMAVVREQPSSNEGVAGRTAEEVAAARGLSRQQLTRTLRGDLDMIVLAALRAEPDRRYASAQALADDLERYLAGVPVRARPDSRLYRAGKFIRRNRIGVAAAALVAAAVGTGSGLALWQARVAAAERDVAREVSTFLEELIASPDPFQGATAHPDSVRMVDFIRFAGDRIRSDLAGQPATRARMLALLSRVHGNLGHGEEAIGLAREAVEASRTGTGEASQETADALRALGFALNAYGDPAEAERVLRDALERQTRLTGESSLGVAAVQEFMARGLLNARRLEEAESLLVASYRTRLAALEPADPLLIHNLNGLAAVHSFRGDYAGALPYQQEAVAILEQAGPAQAGDLAITLGNMGTVYRRLGRLESADTALTRAVGLFQERLGSDHFMAAARRATLAGVRADLGRVAEADSLYAEAIAVLERVAPDNLNLAAELGAWARVLRRQGRLEEAEVRARAAVAAAERSVGHGHPLAAVSTAGLADVLRDRGRLADAVRAYDDALARLQSTVPPTDPNVLGIRLSRAEVWGDLGRSAQVEKELLEIHGAALTALGDEHPAVIRAAGSLAAFYEAAGRPEEAARFR